MYYLHLTNDTRQISELHTWLTRWQQELGITEERLFQINLALEEAVANCMQYAYPAQKDMPIEVTMERHDDELVFVVDDQGVAFDPTKVTAPDITLPAEQRDAGGLGVFLIRQLAKSLSYERVANHNRLTMTFDN